MGIKLDIAIVEDKQGDALEVIIKEITSPSIIVFNVKVGAFSPILFPFNFH